MADNTNLSAARSAKNDEFYTQYGDIEAEMNAYVEYNPDVFRDKTILLPCDDPEWSKFTKYFASNFERFGLKSSYRQATYEARGARISHSLNGVHQNTTRRSMQRMANSSLSRTTRTNPDG